MRSTGESMGIDANPELAYYKALLGAGVTLPIQGEVRLIGDDVAALESTLTSSGFSVSSGVDTDLSEEPSYDLLIDTVHTPELRRALENGVPYVTTDEAARWFVRAMGTLRDTTLNVNALQHLNALPVTR